MSPSKFCLRSLRCRRRLSFSLAEAPYGKFFSQYWVWKARGERWEEGKGEQASLLSFPFPAFPARCRFFPSPQAYGQETFTVKAARKRPPRRIERGYEPNEIWGREKEFSYSRRAENRARTNAKTPSRGPIFRPARTGTLAARANPNSISPFVLIQMLYFLINSLNLIRRMCSTASESSKDSNTKYNKSLGY